jgi:hypothetical protein
MQIKQGKIDLIGKTKEKMNAKEKELSQLEARMKEYQEARKELVEMGFHEYLKK